ncbi:PHB depolymerase family esterase [Rhizobium sp. Root1220]|uniref:extracellular catalytic domain type 1 short-chain-length polyhydroxyalkanoate depolymerase n=1 Tax=Rhizobium sp. Root1220 TaxID=1736432 RepID=UPI0006FA1F1F|nr:PHB depolymerase family esterase [Rhizobium sp. Root1220]KQV65136.1 hypothetical protein ASC90_14650 [Rhizobium sp. Root1220]
MRSLCDTLERLARLSRHTHPHEPASRLADLAFRPNPGELSARLYVPTALAHQPALVVVLHGCTQTAAGYDDSSGWSTLADQFGFVVLYPEQTRGNNPNLCFNWFQTDDIRRDQGEALSIRQMIETVVITHGIDRKRIFATGLSAGGAMANVMLATYPDVFAGGAIIAGLPYGTASTIPEAFDRMRGHGLPRAPELAELLVKAAPSVRSWPTVSIWHGTADKTVSSANAIALLDQWRGVHKLNSEPTAIETADRDTTKVWKDDAGQVLISYHAISGMGHGTPIDVASTGEKAAPFMIDVGISSTRQIAYEWGLTPSFEKRHDSPTGNPSPDNTGRPGGIQETIEAALRSAGLMK